MHAVCLTFLLSLFSPPKTWTAVAPDKDAKMLTSKIFGVVRRQYSLPSGAVVQVRTVKCTEQDQCSADLAGGVSDFSRCYCRGECAPTKQQCAQEVDEPATGLSGTSWARDGNTYGSQNALHVFLLDRWLEEKTSFAFVYMGPKLGLAEFIAVTDKLKPSAKLRRRQKRSPEAPQL